jgi:hypothetical protein
MYFEEIYERSKAFWDGEFYIADYSTDISQTLLSRYYLEEVDEAYKLIEEDFRYWVQLMNWAVYISLAEKGEEFANKGLQFICLKDVPLTLIEYYFKRDLIETSWEKEREMYKGRKSDTTHS